MAGRALPHLQTRYHPPQESVATPTTTPPSMPEAPRPIQQTESRLPEPRPVENRPKVNPDLFPRPLLRHDDYYGAFVPDGALTAPHVYANYTVKEDRYSSPRYLRFAGTCVALDAKTQSAIGIPIACVWHPLNDPVPGEDPPPISDVTSTGPFRCSRCLAYANPFFTFPDNGKNVTCNLCGLTQPCPEDLFSDRSSRPEMFAGTYDFQVAKEFIVKPPQMNTFLVYLDVSAEAVAAGLPMHVLTSLKSTVDYIPFPERTRIAIATYSDKFVYYRPCANGLPIEIVINELEEPFVSDSVESLAFSLETQKDALVAFIDALGQKLATAQGSKQLISPGAVASAAKDLLDYSGGRVLIFVSTLGTIGKFPLRNREDSKLYQTDNEKAMYVPQHEQLYDLAKDACTAGVTFDFFVCSGKTYVDTASMYPLSSITGGDLHYWPGYGPRESERLHFTLVRTLTRNQAFQVLMRVRCGNGLTVDEYVGHYNRRGPTDMELSSLDPDKSIAIFLKHEEKLKEGIQYYIQCAMLHTSIDGRRFIRVCNGAVKATTELAAIYRGADCEVLANVVMRRQLLGLLTTPVRMIKEHWHEQIVGLLVHYRMFGIESKESTSLMLPEMLNNLPLVTLAGMKLPAFSGRANADLRMAYVAKVKGATVIQSYLMLYPRIYSVHDLLLQAHQPGTPNRSELTTLPSLVPATINKVQPTGAYLFDNGDVLTLYVGSAVPGEFLLDVNPTQTFTVQSYDELAEEVANGLPQLDSQLSVRLNAVIEELRRRNPGKYQSLAIVMDTG